MIRQARVEDAARNLQIWRGAVAATHDFLSTADLAEIDALVARWLPTAAPWVFCDDADEPVAFMALTDAHVDALFVDPNRRGGGVGRTMIDHARGLHGALTVDVNEQNPLAVGLYERVGFQHTGRSPTDDQGRAYPLVHMALRG